MDRSYLTKGVWDTDIDTYPEKQYSFEFYGYKCKIKRNDFWVWCGYCQLPDAHPYCNESYTSDNDDINVHGGITFASNNTFGFDCAHYNDLIPGYSIPEIKFNWPTRNGHYWTFDDVKKEVENMAKQFKAIEDKYCENMAKQFKDIEDKYCENNNEENKIMQDINIEI